MGNAFKRNVSKTLLNTIKIYQKSKPIRVMINRLLFIPQGTCRYLPTCSDYMHQAIVKFGPGKGLFIGIKRIFRCHPFAKKMYDPVP